MDIATLRTITTRLQICPNVLHEHPIYEIKVVVRRALTSKRIPVPFFLNETLNPHCNVNMMHKPFTKNCQMKKIIYCMQDSTTAHIACNCH